MNKYLKDFLLRGLMFSGFGPIICGIIFLILNYTVKDFSLSGSEIFLAIISTYIIAFVHAGTSVFHQVEHFSPMKSAGLQLGLLYIVYIVGYLINSWLKFEWLVILIFTVIFIVGYFIIWTIVYLVIKSSVKKLNKQI